jgi:hypothetical protein
MGIVDSSSYRDDPDFVDSTLESIDSEVLDKLYNSFQG